ncbi:MBL fold metallo-hydrolase [Sinanaerobacter sp. ZZT-01]|jgi:phosphoribosyl 1,2-cyclic phosphodiesterase|uniref:MBL fold metallo-hydrolase n=1 Tax=Sinanaerobacter sp. ZZT-01 TaxID=3111540 RepID=UPI002D77F25E|nr:MBL fold metallo-hydrolase [Sinanaerobacter sp. ZZT-01]WRR94746.1 MBL fold metallo-hydrolase [Sinanaerobacter sp. ZZT-01]
MTLRFCSFSSGSSGNCYLVKTDKTALLVDAGISGKKIWNGIEKTGTSIQDLKGVLITHEHSDHTKGVRILAKKEKGLNFFANKKTWSQLKEKGPSEQCQIFKTGDSFLIGDIQVKTFSVSHDAADPVGFSFSKGEKQVCIVTDTGCICEDLLNEMRFADLLVLEANHDIDMLKIGKYPWFLKQRVLGDQGHLSNESAAKTLVRLLKEEKRKRQVLLAHLSRENNFPQMAFQTVKNILEEEDYYIGKDIGLNLLLRDQLSLVYDV